MVNEVYWFKFSRIATKYYDTWLNLSVSWTAKASWLKAGAALSLDNVRGGGGGGGGGQSIVHHAIPPPPPPSNSLSGQTWLKVIIMKRYALCKLKWQTMMTNYEITEFMAIMQRLPETFNPPQVRVMPPPQKKKWRKEV